MRNVIYQSVVLPASAEALFAMYLDPAVHGAITGTEVEIGSEPGASFIAFEGVLTGHILNPDFPFGRVILRSAGID